MSQPLPQEHTGGAPYSPPMARRGQILVFLWALVSLIVGLVLWGFTFLDTFGAGDAAMSLNSDQVTPYVDHVRYTLLGFTYLNGGTVLTGPHRSFPLSLVWLLVTSGTMWIVWRQTGAWAAQRVMRTGVLSLAVILVLGGLTLSVAERRHNMLLRNALHWEEVRLTGTSASTAALMLWRCDQVNETAGCTQQMQLNFPNPTLWGLIAIVFTVGAALWRPSSA